MRASGDSPACQELRDLLASATQKVRRAMVGRALARFAEPAVYTALAVGVICAVVRLAAALNGSSSGVSGLTYAICVVLAAALPLIVAAICAYARPPELDEVAERLDLGAGAHNQIAIAVSFTASAAPSTFAQAAIRDGLHVARRLAQSHPCRPTSPVRGRRLFVGALLCLAVGVLSGYRVERPSVAAPDRTSDSSLAAATRRSDPADEPRPQNLAVKPPNAAPSHASAPPATDAEVARTPLSTKQTAAAAAGRMAPGSVAAGGASEQPAAVGTEASGVAGKSGGRREAHAAKRSPTTPPQPETAANRPPPANEQSASASAGSAAGLCRAPVQQGWPQRDAASAEREEAESDEPTADESKTSTQRGGIQPSLKDRQDPPNRDLGISSDQGPPGGTGRGGPTPPKKSRGTASLVLGVPVPDFVRGRLGPGPTKVARERVPPSAAPGASAVPAPAAARAAAEASLPISRIPVEFAAQVRDYLVALHAQASRAVENGAAAAPVGAGPREETP